MAIKISGDTIIDDSRVIVNADKIGIGTTNPHVSLEISNGDVGIGTTNPSAAVLNTNTSKLAVGIVTANTIFGNLVGGITNTGDITIDGNLTVEGNTTLGDASSDTLTVNATPTFKENATFEKNVQIDGVLTYEDVTNVDSIGLITARNGIHVLGAGVSVAGFSTFFNTVEFQDKVGINSTSPHTKLDVIHSYVNRTWTPASSNTALFERNGINRIAIVAGDSSQSQIDFADTNDDNAGYIRYDHSDNSMSFRTNGADNRLRILSNGDVGIGSDSTGGARLRVFDNGTDTLLQQWRVNLGSTAGQRSFNLYSPATDTTSDYYRFQTGNAIKFQIDSIDALCIDDGGKVGIGTDNPLGTLSLIADDQQSQADIVFQTKSGTSLAHAALSTTDDSGGTDVMLGSNLYLSTNGAQTRYNTGRSGSAVQFDYSGTIRFYNNSSNNAPTERLRISNNGNVGINQASPEYRLDVKENIGVSRDASGNDRPVGFAVTIARFTNFRIPSGGNSLSLNIYDKRINDLYNNNWAGTERRLEYTVDNNASKRMWIGFLNETNSAADNIIRFGESLDTEWMRIDNGDVGIGTTDPRASVKSTNTSLLAVGIVTANTFFGNLEGGISNTGDVTIDGNLNVKGNVDLGDASSDTISFLGKVDSNILPDGTRNLGSSGNKWSNVYATTFNGDLTGDVTGDVTGNADTADKVDTIKKDDLSTGYLTFVDSNNTTATAEEVFTATGITVDSSVDKITATTFAGDLTGNVTGDVTGNADTATDLAINATQQLVIQTANNATSTLSSGTVNYILTSGGSGSAPTWEQNFAGNAATATSATNATNATNATHVTVTDNESAAEENLITFVENEQSTTGNHGLEMDGNLTYNPSTGTLTATTFKGNVEGGFTNTGNVTIDGTLSVTGNVTLGNNVPTDLVTFTSRVNSNFLPQPDNSFNPQYDIGGSNSSSNWKDAYFSGTVNATTFDGNLTGNADTATSATSATTATNATNATKVATTASAATSDQFVTFVNSSSGNNSILVDAGIKYKPSTDTLTVAGDLSVGGTLTYEDVTNIDSVGVITAQNGIHVLAGGMDVVGVSTFNDNLKLDERLIFTSSLSKILTDTEDGADNKLIAINGGGDTATTRGALVTLYGNELNSGRLDIASGKGGGNITFNTGTTSAERMVITGAGQLNVAVNMQFTHSNPELEFNNGGPRFRVPAANTLAYHSGGTLGSDTNERVRITSSGDVGIGTDNPTGANALLNNSTTLAVGTLKANTITGSVKANVTIQQNPPSANHGDLWWDSDDGTLYIYYSDVDSSQWVSVSGGGSGLTVEDEGVTLSNPATTLNFVGSGVVASGTGSEKTITISSGGTTPEIQQNMLSSTISTNSTSFQSAMTQSITPNASNSKLLVTVAGIMEPYRDDDGVDGSYANSIELKLFRGTGGNAVQIAQTVTSSEGNSLTGSGYQNKSGFSLNFIDTNSHGGNQVTYEVKYRKISSDGSVRIQKGTSLTIQEII